jgi:hypothetical protein
MYEFLFGFVRKQSLRERNLKEVVPQRVVPHRRLFCYRDDDMASADEANAPLSNRHYPLFQMISLNHDDLIAKSSMIKQNLARNRAMPRYIVAALVGKEQW